MPYDDAPSEDDIPYRGPTVEDCIMRDYTFARDFRVSSIPPFPQEDYRNADAQKKRSIAKPTLTG